MRLKLRPDADPARVRLIVTDADGIWTDGSIYMDDSGAEFKRFFVRDGLAVVLARRAGLKFAVLSARESTCMRLRAEALGVDLVSQGCGEKREGLRLIRQKFAVDPAETLYMGDDLPDLPALVDAGVAVTVPEAPPEVLCAADAVTELGGGRGAIREMVEWVLRSRGSWDEAKEAYK